MSATDSRDTIPIPPVSQAIVTSNTDLSGNPMGDQEFGARLFQAWSLWQGTHGRRLSQTKLGEMVGKLRGDDPVPQSTVSDWFNGVIPSVEDIEYLATALGPGIDPGWLGFGSASKAPAPDVPAALLAQPVPRSKSKQKRA